MLGDESQIRVDVFLFYFFKKKSIDDFEGCFEGRLHRAMDTAVAGKCHFKRCF